MTTSAKKGLDMNCARFKTQTLSFAVAILTMIATVNASADFGSITNVFDTLIDKMSLTEAVPPITVNGLGKFQNQYLSIYYVVGQSQFLDQQVQIHVRETKRIDRVIIKQDEINLSSVRVAKKALYAAYNYVILVVSKSPHYTLYNPDGKVAPGQSNSDAQADDTSVYKIAISKAELLAPSMPDGVYEPGQMVPKQLVPFKIHL